MTKIMKFTHFLVVYRHGSYQDEMVELVIAVAVVDVDDAIDRPNVDVDLTVMIAMLVHAIQRFHDDLCAECAPMVVIPCLSWHINYLKQNEQTKSTTEEMENGKLHKRFKKLNSLLECNLLFHFIMQTENSEYNTQNPNWNRQNKVRNGKKRHRAFPKNHFLHFAHTNTHARAIIHMHINARINRLRLNMMDCKLTTRLIRHDAIHFFFLKKKTFQLSERLLDKLMWLRPNSHCKLI